MFFLMICKIFHIFSNIELNWILFCNIDVLRDHSASLGYYKYREPVQIYNPYKLKTKLKKVQIKQVYTQ